MFHANGEQKKAGMTILRSDKIDSKTASQHKFHYIMIKEAVQQKEITINIHTLVHR